MTALRKSLLAAAILAVPLVSPTASAQTFLNDWYFCLDGGCTGANYNTAGNGNLINEFLDIVGPSYVATSVPGGGGAYTFEEWGAFNTVQHDGGTSYANGSNQITATFTGQGSAVLGGALTFDAYGGAGTLGVINVYSDATANFAHATYPPTIYGADDGTLIGTFEITEGDGEVNSSGLPNGDISITAQASYLASGYFFDNGGTDLQTLVGDGLLFAFSTTNASRVENASPTIISDIVGGFAGNNSYTNPGVLPDGSQAGDFVLSNNGQYRLATGSIPEPATVALFGIGLVGLGARLRTRKA